MIFTSIYEGTSIIFWLVVIFTGIVIFRCRTEKDWYFNVIKPDGTIEISQEAIDFNKQYMSEEYASDLMKQGIYAIVWLSVTYLILIMTLVGGSAITDNNPFFKIPCLILVLIMELIMISKPVFLVGAIMEDFILKGGVAILIAKTIRNEPMKIRISKNQPNMRKIIKYLG
jgi:hypothetical protein